MIIIFLVKLRFVIIVAFIAFDLQLTMYGDLTNRNGTFVVFSVFPCNFFDFVASNQITC